MKIIQNDLDDIAAQWNNHRIRKQNVEAPDGIPNVLHFLPESEGWFPLSNDLLNWCVKLFTISLGGTFLFFNSSIALVLFQQEPIEVIEPYIFCRHKRLPYKC